MTTFTTGGSAVTFTTSGSAVSFAVTAASNDFTTSAVLTPGAHASTHGAGGADPITTLGTVTTTLGSAVTLNVGTATISVGTVTTLSATNTATFGSAVSIATGGAASPTLRFTGDTNTGIYSPGADQLGIATAGTARVVVDGSGLMGVGVTSPGATLHIVNNSAEVLHDRYSSDNAAANYIFRKSRGSVGAGTAIASDDYIGALLFRGYGATGFGAANVGLIGIRAAEAFTDSAQGTYFTLGLTPTGSTTRTERVNISSAGLITGTGTSLGAWTSYTPTLGGFTLGDGTWSAAYMRIGKVCVFRAVLTFGSTTTAASAFPTFTLPVTAAGTTNIAMNAQFFDTSASAYYTATSRQSSTTVVTMGILGASGVHTTCTTTTPFTWGVGDQIILSGTYEIA